MFGAAVAAPPRLDRALATDYGCTEVIGFSQTSEWYQFGDFESFVDGSRWQLRWNSGASIEKWVDPGYAGWDDDRLFHHCAAGPVDRVVLTITGPSRDEAAWADSISGAVGTVQDQHPDADILLQPVVGGPGYQLCESVNGQGDQDEVRASRNAPIIADVVADVAAQQAGVAVGALPKLASCDQYSDTIGHLTTAGEDYAGTQIGAFYGGGAVSLRRLSGGSRIETAVAVSGEAFAPGVARAYVATGWNFPDALAASAAGALLSSPVLLTSEESLPSATAEEIDRLDPGQVSVAGGTAVIHDDVIEALRATVDAQVTRIAGADRYATAAEIAVRASVAPVPVVLIATGEAFPDALSGGPAAGRLGASLLLTGRDTLPLATQEALEALQPEQILVFGGSAAVSDSVVAALGGFTDGPVERVFGPDRYATAAAVSQEVFPQGASTVFLVTGQDFPDALSAGPAAAGASAPLLLVRRDSLPEAAAAELARLSPSEIVVVGGEAAVSAEVAAAAVEAAGG